MWRFDLRTVLKYFETKYPEHFEKGRLDRLDLIQILRDHNTVIIPFDVRDALEEAFPDTSDEDVPALLSLARYDAEWKKALPKHFRGKNLIFLDSTKGIPAKWFHIAYEAAHLFLHSSELFCDTKLQNPDLFNKISNDLHHECVSFVLTTFFTHEGLKQKIEELVEAEAPPSDNAVAEFIDLLFNETTDTLGISVSPSTENKIRTRLQRRVLQFIQHHHINSVYANEDIVSSCLHCILVEKKTIIPV